MFERLTITEVRSMVLVKRVFKLMLGVYLVVGLIALYRAWFQVKSLDLRSPKTDEFGIAQRLNRK
ncbi:MAG: hypothetical protein H0U60_03005 [Blastocatellia bacterium]|nr:hypothetical protein [Blastocatellia bacterium]